MSMAKGLLPDTHEQSASAARSYVLPEADVVMLIGARLNWLLSHGKGKTWGGATEAGAAEVHPDRHLADRDATATCAIDAPVVGDIGSCVAALLDGIGAQLAEAAGRVDRRHRRAQGQERRQDGRDAGEEPVADELPERAQRRARHRQGEPGRDPRQRRRQHARLRALASSTCTSRASASTSAPGASWASAWASPSPPPSITGKPVIAIEGDSAFGFSGMEVETICRYNLPVCVVVFNNNGVYRGTDVNPTRRRRSVADWCSSRTRATTR